MIVEVAGFPGHDSDVIDGYLARPLAQGLAETIAWLRERGEWPNR